jgi:hypothetical protein
MRAEASPGAVVDGPGGEQTLQPTSPRRLPRRLLLWAACRHPFEVLVSIVSAAYVALALSPSSYALALRDIGVAGRHPYLGTPRPERWDEWAVLTPYVQATVRSGFSDVNTTSYYQESLRNLMHLPVMDWGFALRPLQWGYAILPPAWAFSLCWALAAWMFLVGWSLLLRRVGMRYSVAVAAVVALFLSGLTQAWWSGIAPLVAFVPWILLVAGWAGPLAVRLPLVAWLTGSWVVSAAYLPGLLHLGFLAAVVGAVFLLRRETLRSLLAVTAAAGVGGAVGVVYLMPVLRVLTETVYPGDRVVAGGGLSWAQWLSQIAPGGVSAGFDALLPGSLPERLAVGTLLPLLALALVDYRRVRAGASAVDLRRLVALLGAFGLVTLWQVTSWGGVPAAVLGWNRSSEQRSLLLSGTLLVLAAAWALSRLPLRLTTRRLVAFLLLQAGVAALPALLVARSPEVSLRHALSTTAALVGASVVLAIVASLVSHWTPRAALPAALVCAVLPTAALWATYNPVQDSRIIFTRHDTPVTRTLDAAADVRPDRAVAVPMSGAVANGLGFRSVYHVLPLPQLDDYRRMFPHVPEDELNRIFNRYSEAIPVEGRHPQLLGEGVVGLPLDVVLGFAALPPSQEDPPQPR